MTVALSFGIPLLRAMNPEETAALILRAAEQGRARASGSLPRPGHRPRGKAGIQSHILQGLPGVGPERAKRLIDAFGTVEGVMTATIAELAAVPGIGKGIAERIRWAVEEQPAAYSAKAGAREQRTCIGNGERRFSNRRLAHPSRRERWV